MIFCNTLLNIQDNSGAKGGLCIKIKKNSNCKKAKLNDIIKVTIKKLSKHNKNVTKGSLFFAYITQIKKKTLKQTGINVKFDFNSIILLNNTLQPIGTRILGPISIKNRTNKNFKIISLSSFIL